MPTMTKRQREAALAFKERHGDEAAAEMLQVMGFTDAQIARAFIPEPQEPEVGRVVRFKALGSYNYAAIRVGDHWYVTNDGARRSSAVPRMTWSDLLEWGGQQMRDTLQIMMPVEEFHDGDSRRIAYAIRALKDATTTREQAIANACAILEDK